jgi:D-tyrosyl-tRNA(Tyr) deacylase
MRAVIQRVSRASVFVDHREVASIGSGLLLLLGVGREDGAEDVEWLANKVSRLRIWEDEEGLMNRSIGDVSGSVLVVSQFTLWGNLKKGSRPSYNRAAAPEAARAFYEDFARRLSELLGKPVPTGCFGADMKVDLINDGPVTLILDTLQRGF